MGVMIANFCSIRNCILAITSQDPKVQVDVLARWFESLNQKIRVYSVFSTTKAAMIHKETSEPIKAFSIR